MPYMTHLNDEQFEVDFWFASQFDCWFEEFRKSDTSAGLFETTVAPYGWYTPESDGEAEPPEVFGEAISFFASKGFVDLLEELEPSVHSYAKFELRYGTEEDYTTHEYYAVRPGHYIRAALPLQSDIEWLDESKGIWKKSPNTPLTLDANLIESRHLWHQPAGRVYRFISDELHDAMQARGMTTSWLFEKQIVGKQPVAAE